MKQRNDIHLNREIEEDYMPNNDLFNGDSERMLKIKNVIFRELTIPERNAILYYAECQSQRKLANKLGISIALSNRYINEIRKKIFALLKEKQT